MICRVVTILYSILISNLINVAVAQPIKAKVNPASKKVEEIVIPRTYDSKIANALEFKKLDPIDFYEKTIPKLFCQEGEYYLECFDVKKQKCKEAIILSSKFCRKSLAKEIAEAQTKFNSERAELFEHIRVGYCIGEEYEKKFRTNKKDEEKCFYQKNWVR